MPPRRKKRVGVSPAEKLRVQQRVDELVRKRLDGANWIDVREFAREAERKEGSPWKLAANRKPMSDGQLRRYVQRADNVIQAQGRTKRRVLICRHFARLENLYAKSVLAGDLRTALAILAEVAKRKRLYPPDRHEITGKDGHPLLRSLSDADLKTRRAEVEAQLAAARRDVGGDGAGGAPSPPAVGAFPGATDGGADQPG